MKTYFYRIDIEANNGVAFGLRFFGEREESGFEIGLIWWNLIVVF